MSAPLATNITASTGRLVWTRAAKGALQAFVFHGGRLFRVVYSAAARAISIAFADARVPLLVEAEGKAAVPMRDVSVTEGFDSSPVEDEERFTGFLSRALSLFSSMGLFNV